jgi:hypothetical protein
MSGPGPEHSLEDHLQHRTVLQSRIRALDRLEPPPELDRIVLARAREAIRVAESPALDRSALRSSVPFAFAAGLVLSIALAVLLHAPWTTHQHELQIAAHGSTLTSTSRSGAVPASAPPRLIATAARLRTPAAVVAPAQRPRKGSTISPSVTPAPGQIEARAPAAAR